MVYFGLALGKTIPRGAFMDELSIPSRVDPGTPVELQSKHFWVWVGSVRLYKSPGRGESPLNAKSDLYPIINVHYQPKPGAQSPPNPSMYLSILQAAGAMRLFGPKCLDNFYVPETEITITVRGRVVYTPADLQALLAKEDRFVFQASGAAEEKKEKTVERPPLPTKTPRTSTAREGVRKDQNHRGTVATREVFEQTHQALWDVATPTEASDVRILSRRSAIDLVTSRMEDRMAIGRFFRHGRLRDASDKDFVWIRIPTGSEVPKADPAPDPASAKPTEPSDPRPLGSEDLKALDQEALDAHLAVWIQWRDKAQQQIDAVGAERGRRTQIEGLLAQRVELERRRGELDSQKDELNRRIRELGGDS